MFPALVGLLNGFELVTGGGWGVAAAAGVISLLLVVGLARQKRWERPNPRHPSAKAPLFVRLSTWFFTTLMVPNVLFGVLVLTRRGEGLDYARGVAHRADRLGDPRRLRAGRAATAASLAPTSTVK